MEEDFEQGLLKIGHRDCLNCGGQMDAVFDEIAQKYTGYSWNCSECMPENVIINIG